MKKIGIITINDNNNYGNRLQNYAVQKKLEKLGMQSETIKNIAELNTKNLMLLRYCKYILKNIKKPKRTIRNKKFNEFNKNIIFSDKTINAYSVRFEKEYDCFITGSDQVWNPTVGRFRDVDVLAIVRKKDKIAFAASLGISKFPEDKKIYAKEKLKTFKAISVREDAGKEILEELTGRKDIQVLVDPTMLLTAEEWDKVSKKPEQLKKDKYILNYFLGELSEERKEEINRVAKENNCKVINILDKNSSFYETGPSEFLYLEKNAFLVCTDSFHSSVFAILYNRPFIVFDREDSLASMNSRIETLINKFNLKNRKFNGKITEENLKHDYTEAYEILEKERKKTDDFLRRALDIDEQEGAR